jgi:hypothetical protein
MSNTAELQDELSQATCNLIDAVAFAAEWQEHATKLQKKIERALQVLKSIPSGGEWVLLQAEELDKLRRILEGKEE